MGIEYVRFRSAERTNVSYFILNGSTLRNKLYKLFYMIFNGLLVLFLSTAV